MEDKAVNSKNDLSYFFKAGGRAQSGRVASRGGLGDWALIWPKQVSMNF